MRGQNDLVATLLLSSFGKGAVLLVGYDDGFVVVTGLLLGQTGNRMFLLTLLLNHNIYNNSPKKEQSMLSFNQ